jgi:CBS domain-containing protein
MKCPNCGYENLPGADQCEQCLSSLTRDDVPQAESGVERSLMEDPVACLLPIQPLTVEMHTSLADALELMRNHHIGCLLVTAREGSLAGILTERDLLQKVALETPRLTQCRVEDFMSGAPETSKPDHPLAYAIQRMIVSDLRYLPLVDDTGRPNGIVSSRDIIAYIAKNLH